MAIGSLMSRYTPPEVVGVGVTLTGWARSK